MKKNKVGDRESLDFKDSKGTKGKIGYFQGFDFDNAVGQREIIELTSNEATNVDLRQGNIFKVDLTKDITFGCQLPKVGVYTFFFVQDSTGSHSVTFPDSYKVASLDGAPDFGSDSAGTINIVSVLYDGSNYYITYTNNYVNIGSL